MYFGKTGRDLSNREVIYVIQEVLEELIAYFP
jgi:hypothetical protein